MSANAFGSDWVSLEGHTAIFRDPQNLERRFLPLRLDDAPIKAMLRGYAYINWQSEADRQAQLARLLEACGARQRQTGAKAAGVPSSSAGEETTPRGPVQPRQPLGLAPEPPAPLAPPAPANPAPAQPATAAASATPQHPRSLQLLQPGPALSVGWSPDGARLLSGGADGTLRLWEAASGRELAVLEGHKDWVWSVGWSPDGGLWAADAFGLVLLWPTDLQATPPPASDDEASSSYTNAKVLVVGESGAGKTGLTRRLATGTFEESEASTVGAWCTQWSLAQPTAASFGEPQREVWLWDFGGQADQRLIHQLFLDRAALVLLLFNAERDEVVEGLRDWQTALRRSLDEPPPQLLVAARVDAGFGASRTLLQRFAAENGSRLLETSARDGSGCPELIAAIAETIPWDRLPRHTSPRLFQRIKAEILRLRDGGEALLTYKDLRERLRLPFPSLDDATLRTVLGLLDGPGVLKQLDYGDYVLLKPEWLGGSTARPWCVH
jgi:GTPase SAR1 family protein